MTGGRYFNDRDFVQGDYEIRSNLTTSQLLMEKLDGELLAEQQTLVMHLSQCAK
jgi:hypothetical protein